MFSLSTKIASQCSLNSPPYLKREATLLWDRRSARSLQRWLLSHPRPPASHSPRSC